MEPKVGDLGRCEVEEETKSLRNGAWATELGKLRRFFRALADLRKLGGKRAQQWSKRDGVLWNEVEAVHSLLPICDRLLS